MPPRDALDSIVERSRSWNCVGVVGAPLVANGRLYNTAVVIHRAKVIGWSPRATSRTIGGFYEKRQFSVARESILSTVEVGGRPVPFGTDRLFECGDVTGLIVHVEICEDVWVPIPPSTYGAMAGATVLVNLSASNVTVGKADYRRELAASQSGRRAPSSTARIRLAELNGRSPNRSEAASSVGFAASVVGITTVVEEDLVVSEALERPKDAGATTVEPSSRCHAPAIPRLRADLSAAQGSCSSGGAQRGYECSDPVRVARARHFDTRPRPMAFNPAHRDGPVVDQLRSWDAQFGRAD